MKTKSLLTLLLVTGLLWGCAGSYNKTVAHVERDRYMGDWYVQAGRFTVFEKDAYNSVESYKWNEKEQRIDIDFHYNEGSVTGPYKEIPQKAWIHDGKTNAHWKVQVWWPLKFSYLIIALDPDYQWTAVGVPDEDYLWIMSRDPHFPKEKTEAIIEQVRQSGYSTKDIQWIQHK
jgi:apolipoprotein D and lipocalin family protein